MSILMKVRIYIFKTIQKILNIMKKIIMIIIIILIIKVIIIITNKINQIKFTNKKNKSK